MVGNRSGLRLPRYSTQLGHTAYRSWTRTWAATVPATNERHLADAALFFSAYLVGGEGPLQLDLHSILLSNPAPTTYFPPAPRVRFEFS